VSLADDRGNRVKIATAMGSYRVLVIDDVLEARRVIRSSLESLGRDLEVVDVPSGEEAMLEVSRESFDLLVVDIRLAGISGLELLEKLRRRYPDLKAMVITGLRDPTIRQQAEKLRVESYFTKPVKVPDFLAAVERSLGLVESTPQELPLPGEPVLGALEDEGQVEERPVTLAERLSGLRQDMDALVALILDDGGHVVATAGALPDWLTKPAMLTALVNATSASLGVSFQMGVQAPRNLLSFPGLDFDLHLRPVTPDLTLLVVAPSNARDEAQNKWPFQMQSASLDLQAILARMGVPSDKPDLGSVEIEERVENDEMGADTDELDQVFNHSAKTEMNPEAVDEFWDSIIDQVNSERASNTGELSYDDARRLGLAPGDGN
jgi:CheY-like chemotaxis protein